MAMAKICAASCAQGADCNSGCCLPLSPGPGGACAPPSYCAPPAPTAGCAQLILQGEDGQYLGDATSNQFAPNGVCNTQGLYGGQLGTDSIYNPFGIYGSQSGALSAYDQFTTTPPHLECATTSEALNFVSKNTFLPNVIDPDDLCATLQAAGL
jgi:hypothetical protein